MELYDPTGAIDPEEWTDLAEAERISLVERYHRQKRIEMPNMTAHALIHVIVENQIAMGNEIAAQQTLERLMSEGLNRHDAVHAIGSVVAERIFTLLKNGRQEPDAIEDYSRRLQQLTAEGWLNSFNEDDED